MRRKTELALTIPLLFPIFPAHALLAEAITATWVQGTGSVVPHSIAGAEALLALESGDEGFVAAAATEPDRVDFTDGNGGTVGLFPNSLQDPFTLLVGGSPSNDPQFAVRVSGTLIVDADADFSFQVFSDDGFDFRIDGASALSFDGDRGPSSSRIDLFFLSAGAHSFELIGWEQGGQFALELSWAPDGSESFNVLSTVPVPLPASLSLLALGLLGLRRRHAR